jgi:putative ABC transport system permease protein
VPASSGLSRPLAEAAAYGLLTALIFTIWPLARARDIKAAALFRDLTAAVRGWPRRPYVLLTARPRGALVALATALSDDADARALVGGGGDRALGVLRLAAAGRAAAGARGASRAAACRAGGRRCASPSARSAGPGGETASVVLSLGLGLAVLATVGQIDWNLRNLITGELPERAPAYFFVDIQNDQLSGFSSAPARAGVTEIETAPMLRGIITRINDRPAREVVGSHWALRGDRGVTYAAAPPEGATHHSKATGGRRTTPARR